MKIEYGIGIILLVLGVLALGVLFLSEPAADSKTVTTTTAEGEIQKQPYVEIVNPSGFVNTNDVPITIGEYVGKRVILLDIMTYSCINCQRTFPYVAGWYEKYKDDGLIVIGIHTPEFAFEKDKKNVENAMKEFGITFPVVLDNNYETWRALGNRYWPRKYLIDIHGDIVYDHIGEGAYEETEAKIQELLKERAEVLGENVDIDGELISKEVSTENSTGGSPEAYFGSFRNEYLANGEPGKTGEIVFSVPQEVKENMLYFGGMWNLQGEYAESKQDTTIVYKYTAKEVYLVAESEGGGTIEVWQDGKRVGAEAGENAPAGIAPIKESRLYKLIKNETTGQHTLELKVSPGVKVFAFTFG